MEEDNEITSSKQTFLINRIIATSDILLKKSKDNIAQMGCGIGFNIVDSHKEGNITYINKINLLEASIIKK